MLASKELLIRCLCVDCASRAKDALDALVLPSAERQHKQRISRSRRGRGLDCSAAPGFKLFGIIVRNEGFVHQSPAPAAASMPQKHNMSLILACVVLLTDFSLFYSMSKFDRLVLVCNSKTSIRNDDPEVLFQDKEKFASRGNKLNDSKEDLNTTACSKPWGELA